MSPRLALPGTLDPTFGGTGVVTRDAGFPAESAYDVLSLPRGKVLAVGGGGGGYARRTDSVMLRYNDHGAPDPSFGSGGIIRTDLRGDFDERAGAAALLPDGSVVVAGTLGMWDFLTDYETYATVVAWLARYRPDGTLDPSFGDGGTRRSAWDDFRYEPGASLAVLPDGSYLVAHSLGLDRFSGSGEPLAGPPLSPWIGDYSDERPAMGGAPGGEILVAGGLLTRLNSDLTPDGSFGGGDGVAIADFGRSADVANDVLALPDGKVVVALGADPSMDDDPAASEFAVARFTAGGVPDPSFGTGGRAVASGPGGAGSANAVTWTPRAESSPPAISAATSPSRGSSPDPAIAVLAVIFATVSAEQIVVTRPPAVALAPPTKAANPPSAPRNSSDAPATTAIK